MFVSQFQTLGLETTIPLAILWIHGVAVHLTLLLKYLKENFIMVHSWIFGWVTIDIIYFTQGNIHWNPMHESHNCAAFYMVKYCPWTFIQRTTLLWVWTTFLRVEFKMLPNIGIKCLDLEYHAFPRGKRRDELGRPIGEMRGEGSLNSFPTPFTQFLACKQALQGAPVGVGGGGVEGRRPYNYVSGIWISALKKSMQHADWRRWH